jgi:molybdopterin synthase catalytic subunit
MQLAGYDTAMSAQPLIDVQILDRPVMYAPLGVSSAVGAECVFLGRTRRDTHPEHGDLVRLSYEAHQPLAERVLRELAEEAIARWGCFAVRVHHAVCIVPPGEASVLVQVICGHRGEAFEACRFLIDALKAKAPIWKREEWASGATWAQGTAVRT